MEGFESVGQEDSFLGHVGGLHRRRVGNRVETALRVTSQHLNPNGTIHGGVLLTMFDITLGMNVEAYLDSADSGRHPITIQLNSNMIAAAREGELIIGEAVVDGSSRTMSWASGRLHSDGRTLMSGSAVFKNPPVPKADA